MLGLKDVTQRSVVGAYSLLMELEESAADMREFRFGLVVPPPGVAACVLRCIAAWPRLRVLGVRWPARMVFSKLIGMTSQASELEELTLQCVRVTDAECPAAQPLPLLTKVVLRDVECSL